MAAKKPSGFRFRLPWLLQPASPPIREPPTQPPRTTTQTSVASTPAQRPPFRPPGKAPAPPPPAPAAAPPPPAPAAAPPPPAPAAAPPTVATTAPFSPRRSPPQSATSPPPSSISPKSLITKSPTDKTIEPVLTQPTKETQAPTETPVPTTPPQAPPFSPPRQAQSQPSLPQTPPPPSSVSPKKSVPKSPIAKTIKPVVPQPAKETQTITKTILTKETAGPTTPPLSPPLSPHTKAQSQPSPPQITPLPSPSVSPKSSVPKSPIAKNTEPVAAQPDKETQTTTKTTSTIETAGPATLLTQAQSQPSPPQTPPPAKKSETHTPPRSSFPLTSVPADKTSSLPSPPTKTTSEASEIKRSTDITGEKLPVDSNLIPQGNHLALDEKPREITEVRGTQTKSIDSRSPDLKSQKTKLTTATRVPLHREIKDNISRFIHNTATSSAKQAMDEKPASIITIAGDNTGASMHLSLDEIKRGHKLTTDTLANDSAINGDGSSRRDSKAGENKEATAIVNSNIQGINNSMMFNSSVTERNPGVHLGFYRNLENDSMTKKRETIEMQRAEVNIAPPQKLVYDPTIGRYTEEAFMEASECEFEEDEPETSGTGNEIEVL